MKSIILVSNGHGEDFIAASLGAALRAQAECTLTAYPLVGKGLPFLALNIPVGISNPCFPSGGFIRGIGDLLKDLRKGLLSHLLNQRRSIRRASQKADLTIIIGDVLALWIGSGRDKSHTVFLPTAKSDYFMPHTFLEKWIIKKKCARVYTRDAKTAASLSKSQISAHFLGNIIWDRASSVRQPQSTPEVYKIGVLPGSRLEAYQNLELIKAVLLALPTSYSFLITLSVPPQLNEAQLHALFSRVKAPHLSICFSSDFESVIDEADLIIGLAGTANEQAVYWGKRVICFEGSGPQTTRQRFEEQQKLLGEGLIFVSDNTPSVVVEAIMNALKRPQNRDIKPTSGNAKAIAQDILAQ